MTDYQKVCDEIAPIVKPPYHNLWREIDLNPNLSNIYNTIFEWCHNTLSSLSYGFKLGFSRFYFYDSFEVNAVAITSNGNNFIAISKAYVNCFYEIFNDVQSVFRTTEKLKHYTVLNPVNNKIDKFMYNCVYEFTFLHEFAHLLQFKNKRIVTTSIGESFKLLSDSKVDLEKHSREIDADIFATIMIADKLVKSFFQYSNPPTLEIVSNRICITLAAILIYFFRMQDNIFEFYTYKYTHPHPILRIGYIINSFLEYIENNPHYNFKFDRDIISLNSYEICASILEFDTIDTNKFLVAHYTDMENYIAAMDEARKNYPYLVFSQKM